ncbi:unnamed protein product [Vicia faba]|uniref:Uncharacterized protein n=1 Tax=Vicia faba TaxID=3906 RepID=A0AAV1AEH1_VICFA|nr:unnamed protein product [Vicia faba]
MQVQTKAREEEERVEPIGSHHQVNLCHREPQPRAPPAAPDSSPADDAEPTALLLPDADHHNNAKHRRNRPAASTTAIRNSPVREPQRTTPLHHHNRAGDNF